MNTNRRWTRLKVDRPLRVRLEQGGRIVVGRGTVWLTGAGDARDRFVSAGGEFRTAQPSDLVIQALNRTASIAVTARPASGCRHRAAMLSFLRTLLPAWLQQAARRRLTLPLGQG